MAALSKQMFDDLSLGLICYSEAVFLGKHELI